MRRYDILESITIVGSLAGFALAAIVCVRIFTKEQYLLADLDFLVRIEMSWRLHQVRLGSKAAVPECGVKFSSSPIPDSPSVLCVPYVSLWFPFFFGLLSARVLFHLLQNR